MKTENLVLKFYAITVTGILLFALFTSFKPDANQKFEEITVKRINIIEPDGKLKMVISNAERQHPGMMDGKMHDKRQRPPGILFFNEEQDEVGGLSYYGNKNEGGNQLFLSFDQYKEDQIMQLMEYTRQNGENRYGLQLWERDKGFTMEKRMLIMDSLENAGYNYRQKLNYLKELNQGEPLLEPRMFVGKNYNGETGLFIQDKYGVDRLRVYIDSNNLPKLELLDEKGNLVKDIFNK
ncbi:hypothetical protein [Lentiprolixibacter aurantiacus]|uniref:Uncharacterized protein n=1 Tax=Lentiprolixibacter aurantiacus TaxID=2993939 RepID=A0AAE3MIL8_9FLAO|nr:hypothetical protein [Lentiprolixibacter aurantiacus]MCX2718108.1 hypothetical protein [Lentiprolixibacter aurantiacus]